MLLAAALVFKAATLKITITTPVATATIYSNVEHPTAAYSSEIMAAIFSSSAN